MRKSHPVHTLTTRRRIQRVTHQAPASSMTAGTPQPTNPKPSIFGVERTADPKSRSRSASICARVSPRVTRAMITCRRLSAEGLGQVSSVSPGQNGLMLCVMMARATGGVVDAGTIVGCGSDIALSSLA